jgi:hypothetical protein
VIVKVAARVPARLGPCNGQFSEWTRPISERRTAAMSESLQDRIPRLHSAPPPKFDRSTASSSADSAARRQRPLREEERLSPVALLWSSDVAVQVALGPLLMDLGLVMLTVQSADEVRTYVDSGRAGVVLAGPSVGLLSTSHAALLSCEEVVPVVRLLGEHECLTLSPALAAVRLDATLSVATLAAALDGARALVDDGLGDASGRAETEESRRQVRQWTSMGLSAYAAGKAGPAKAAHVRVPASRAADDRFRSVSAIASDMNERLDIERCAPNPPDPRTRSRSQTLPLPRG